MTEQTPFPRGSVATGYNGEGVENAPGQDAPKPTLADPVGSAPAAWATEPEPEQPEPAPAPVKKAPAKKAAKKGVGPSGLKKIKTRVPAGPRERPTVIVDNLHITYKVWATGKAASGRNSEKKGLLARTPALRRAREVHAVRGISFTAYEGDAIGVVGTNGSGKSTLLQGVAGLVPPARGSIFSLGNPTLLGVGAALMNELSGERNVILGGLALGLSMEEVRAKYDSIVEFSGLEPEFLDLPMRTYSQGMAARLRFSIAASVSHQVLMIDEALSVGDRQFQQRSEARIRELRESAGTVFLVSHALPAITKTCNRVLWIHKGKLIMDGGVDEVIQAYTDSENGPE
ncbi:ABC transporter ATP-binding protein [Kineosporia babensis]|uniref:ABC transporter ATP-binding protein n=1 Tax=Kineosporia babensis TaxID=499548 RepID=A0A9X1NJZ4_9ACTN|nr:ABC transporter ATP-binding protein [Kineosporia babensis]